MAQKIGGLPPEHVMVPDSRRGQIVGRVLENVAGALSKQPSATQSVGPSTDQLSAASRDQGTSAALLPRTLGPDHEAIRTYVVVDGRPLQVSFQQLALGRSVPIAFATLKSSSDPEVDAALLVASKRRAERLASFGQAAKSALDAPPVVASDGSKRVLAYHVLASAEVPEELRLVDQLSSVGRFQGFNVVVHTHASSVSLFERTLGLAQRGNVRVVESGDRADAASFSEGELHADGSITVSPPLAPALDLATELLWARLRRFHPEAQIPARTGLKRLQRLAKEQYPAAYFPASEESTAGRRGRDAIGYALILGTPVRMGLARLAVDNVVVARAADGSMLALVGRDTMALARQLLSRELGRRLGDSELRQAIGHDLGLAPEQVHGVEQPGDGRLGAKLLAVSPGRVVLDDAAAASRVVAAWWRDGSGPGSKLEAAPLAQALARLDQAAKLQGPGERRAADDLSRAGLEVIRQPLVFPDVTALSPVSLAAAEQGFCADGEPFFIAPGADPRAERLVVAALAEASKGGIRRFYFLEAGSPLRSRAKVQVE